MARESKATRLASEEYPITHTCTGACTHGGKADFATKLEVLLNDDAVEPAEFNLDMAAGLGTYRGKVIADLDQVVQQIDTGNSQKLNGGNTITYTFLAEGADLIGLYNNPNYGFGAGNGVSAFSDAQKAAARDAIGLWDDLIAPTFVETKGKGGDIQLANSWDPAQAYAYYPEYYPGNKNGFTKAQGYKFFGDVFISDPLTTYAADGTVINRGNYTNGDLSIGGYGQTTIIHELGHAIGLSHPGAYNGAGATTYVAQAEYAQDSEQYSIMSYWAESETGARVVNWNTLTNSFLGRWANPQTPMLHDIYVVQQKYGADPTTRAGDTTYGFNANAGRDVFDFTINSQPFLAIYDAGGEDTLDFSGFQASTVIDLRDGQFSSAGQGNVTVADVIAGLEAIDQAIYAAYGEIPGFDDYTTNAGQVPTQAFIDSTMAAFMNANATSIAGDFGWGGVLATQYQNIAIAYGTNIENAVGTDYRDIIVTNELDNRLTGGLGADVFVFASDEKSLLDGFSGGGHDTITDFEAGVDMVDLSHLGLNSGSQFFIEDNTLSIDIDGDGEMDQVITFENLDYVPMSDIFA